MGLFGKPATTLTFGVFHFGDAQNKAPTNLYEQNDLAAKQLEVLVKRHYLEQLRPPRKWNYYFHFFSIPDFQNPQTRHLDFRDPNTGEINDHAKYAEVCNITKGEWKNKLITEFPQYKRNKFEDCFEEVKFDYFPEKRLLLMSMLVDGLVKQGTETFKDTRW